jgi:hypothetical protein
MSIPCVYIRSGGGDGAGEGRGEALVGRGVGRFGRLGTNRGWATVRRGQLPVPPPPSSQTASPGAGLGKQVASAARFSQVTDEVGDLGVGGRSHRFETPRAIARPRLGGSGRLSRPNRQCSPVAGHFAAQRRCVWRPKAVRERTQLFAGGSRRRGVPGQHGPQPREFHNSTCLSPTCGNRGVIARC